MRPRRYILVALGAVYALLWVGGVVSYTLAGGPPQDAAWTAPAFLLLASLLTLVSSHPRIVPSLRAMAVIGWLAELAGVHTGLVFGQYRYTDTLGPRILGVPVAIAAAWLILAAYVRQILFELDLPRPLVVLAGAIWMTAIDLLIDPVAANRLGYWSWPEGGAFQGIPLSNFAGWFGVSLVIFATTGRNWTGNSTARYVGLSVLLFFTVIAADAGLIVPAIVGALLFIAHVVARVAGGAWKARIPARPAGDGREIRIGTNDLPERPGVVRKR